MWLSDAMKQLREDFENVAIRREAWQDSDGALTWYWAWHSSPSEIGCIKTGEYLIREEDWERHATPTPWQPTREDLKASDWIVVPAMLRTDETMEEVEREGG